MSSTGSDSETESPGLSARPRSPLSLATRSRSRTAHRLGSSTSSPETSPSPSAGEREQELSRSEQAKEEREWACDHEPLISEWIETILSEERSPNLPFGEWLKDGTLLCAVINTYFPGTIRKINRSPVAHRQIQNIGNYLRACGDFGISPLFNYEDLFHEINPLLVRRNVRALFSHCSPLQIPGLTAPSATLSSSSSSIGARSHQLAEILAWVFDTLRASPDAASLQIPQAVPENDDHFHAAFADGVLLCFLMNALKPGSIANINAISPGAAAGQSLNSIQLFRALDNIERYLLACRTAFGLTPQECFVPNQLSDRKSLSKVYENLFVLRTKIRRATELPKVAKLNQIKVSSSTDLRQIAFSNSNSPPVASPLRGSTTPLTSRRECASDLSRSASASVPSRPRSSSHSSRSGQRISKKSGHSSNTWKLQYPLHYLARKGRLERIKQFDEASFAKPDHRGRLPLHCAALEDQVQVVQYILSTNPALVSVVDDSMDTPLSTACSVGAFTTAQYLLLNGAAADEANNSLMTSLHFLSALHSSRERDSLVKFLLRHGADINARNQYGETPLMLATAQLSINTVKFLVKRKASLGVINQFGETCLHKACRLLEGSPRLATSMITLLLELGVDPNKSGAHGTALSLVKPSKNPDIYRLLLSYMLKADQSSAAAAAGAAGASAAPLLSAHTLSQQDHRASRSLEHLKATAGQLDSLQRINVIELLSGLTHSDETEPLSSSSQPVSVWELSDSLEAQPPSPTPSPPKAQQQQPQPVSRTAIISQIIVPCDGYNVEEVSETTRQKPPKYKMNCGYLLLPPSPYHSEFYGKIHTNFLGILASSKPFIASILDNPVPRGADEVPSFCTLIKTPNLEKVVWIPGTGGSRSKGVSQRVLIEVFKTHNPALFTGCTFYRLPSERSQQQLQLLERQDPIRSDCFPIGIVYAKDGQTSQWDMWGNEEGSPAWDRFLRLMGDTITLRGWSGYSGGLDVQADSKGKYALFTSFQDISIMFHVSTMLPFDPKDPQKLQRSRVIGNDVAMIIFQDGSLTSYVPSTMTGQVSHVFIVVRPLTLTDGSAAYQVGVCSKDFVAKFGPRVPTPNIIMEKDIREWLLTKLLNGFICAQMSPGLSMMYVRPRQHLMTELIQTLAEGQKESFSYKYDKASEKGTIKPSKQGLSSKEKAK